MLCSSSVPKRQTKNFNNSCTSSEKFFSHFNRQKEKERLEREKMERALRDKRCPTCEQKVYPEQAIIVSDIVFHRVCVKCCDCLRAFEGKDMILGPADNPKPYCKFCYAKAFGISALNIGELVQIAPEQQILAQGL